jgi:hypothetical protein
LKEKKGGNRMSIRKFIDLLIFLAGATIVLCSILIYQTWGGVAGLLMVVIGQARLTRIRKVYLSLAIDKNKEELAVVGVYDDEREAWLEESIYKYAGWRVYRVFCKLNSPRVKHILIK